MLRREDHLEVVAVEDTHSGSLARMGPNAQSDGQQLYHCVTRPALCFKCLSWKRLRREAERKKWADEPRRQNGVMLSALVALKPVPQAAPWKSRYMHWKIAGTPTITVLPAAGSGFSSTSVADSPARASCPA